MISDTQTDDHINTRLLARVDGRSICITKSSDGCSSTEDRDR